MTNSTEPSLRQSPARQLSAHEFDGVIRRAAELQAADGETARGSITEAEAMRVGRSLGLSMDSLLRALAETSSPAARRDGLLPRLLAPEIVRASRSVRAEPSGLAHTLECYLVQREHLVVLRRLDDRVVFTRAIGAPAALRRAASRIFRRSPLLRVSTLEMAVHPLDEGTSYVTLSTAVRSTRTITATGAMVGSGTGAAAAAALLAAGAAPELALVAVPAFGAGIAAGGRAHHVRGARRVQTQLESLLDRVERGELPPPKAAWTLASGWVSGRVSGVRPAANRSSS